VQETDNRRLLIRYLLEDLSEGEQDWVEEHYFVDDEFYTKLLVAEDELIDSYAQGELSQDERDRFEQVYMTNPRWRKKVEANRDLLNLIIKSPPPDATWRRRFLGWLRQILAPDRKTGFRYSLAVLLLIGVLCILSGWLVFERGRARRELEQARDQWQQKESDYQQQIAESQQPPPATVSPVVPQKDPEIGSQGKLAQEVRNAKKPGAERQPVRASANKDVDGARAQPPVIAFAFPHPSVRTLNAADNGPRLLTIPRGAILVRLTLDIVPSEYAAYSLSLQKVGGRVIWSQSVPRNRPASSADRIVVDLPAALFQSQDYILQVTATDSAGEEEILARHQLTAINLNLGRAQTDGQPRR